ncbi:hypothetical protein CU097_003080 [Rhizopus azygosporus]|uniref:Uncharacterized protein n=1 Tax=Rhizopus azygosporus TaxID=86630 RepID=A0A367INI7_RHIAZ|nr:hypothetical protein CU097_003080 [Rhizopus azygosporus]
MEPIVALGYYLIAGSLSLDSLEYQLDPTVKPLYQISKDLVMKELLPKNKSVESIQLVLEKIKRQLDHVVDEDKDTRHLAVKKIKECVNESLELISEQNISDNKFRPRRNQRQQIR